MHGIPINNWRRTMFNTGKRAMMNLPKLQAREINMHVNKDVDNYVDNNRNPLILGDFKLFASFLSIEINQLFQ